MKVLVSDKLSQEGIKILKNTDGFIVDIKTGMKSDELKKVIPDYEAIVVRSATRLTKDIITVAAKLRVIGRAGVGP